MKKTDTAAKDKTDKTTDKTKEEKKKNMNPLKVFIKLAPKIFTQYPLMWIIITVLSIMHGIAWGAQTLVQQHFFDSAAALAGGTAMLSDVLFMLAMLGTIYIVCQVLNGAANYMPGVLMGKISGRLVRGIQSKIGRLSPITFEDTDRLDDINKANQGLGNAMWFVFIFVTIGTFYLPYFIFMGWYLFSLKPILALGIVIVFVPTALTQIMRAKVFSKLEDKSAPIRRENGYYQSCNTDREYFKETRLLGGFNFFRNLYNDTLKELNKMSFRASVKSNMCELSMRIVTACGYIVILLMLFNALMDGDITVGAFAAVYSSIGLLYGIMEEVICRHIGSMAQSLGTVSNYMSFTDMPERDDSLTAEQKSTILPEHCDITLDNVSFAYPKAEKKAVDGVSLTLYDGETLAIVGENGSGKSTLIRLITGLYAPVGGEVRYGKISAEHIPMRELFSRTSAVFQKYQRYQMTLRDNIGISDTSSVPPDDILDGICTESGITPSDEMYTNGYDTMLSREFDGIDLSGGQWQRVAIARGFYRSSNLIILDEPTAAIDPYEETRIYNNFAQVAKDKTAVIVTHRLGSVKLADRIAVMHEGKLCELGTHEQLMKQNGIYTRMYESQMSWYEA